MPSFVFNVYINKIDVLQMVLSFWLTVGIILYPKWGIGFLIWVTGRVGRLWCLHRLRQISKMVVTATGSDLLEAV